MTWQCRFVENGGYDCMTDAFYIEDMTKPQFDRQIATLDLRDYGQGNCEPVTVETKQIAESNARLMTAAPDMLEALKILQLFIASIPEEVLSMLEEACPHKQLNDVVAKAEGKILDEHKG